MEIPPNLSEREKFKRLCECGLIRTGKGGLQMLVSTPGKYDTILADISYRRGKYVMVWDDREFETPTDFMEAVMRVKQGTAQINSWTVVHDQGFVLEHIWDYYCETYPVVKKMEGGKFRRWFTLLRGGKTGTNGSRGKWYEGQILRIKVMPTKVLHPTDGVETTSMRFVLNAHYHEDGEYNDFTLEHFYQVLDDEREQFGVSLMDEHMGWTPSTRPKRRRGEPSRASEPADPLSVTAEEVERAIGSRRDLEIVQVMEAEIAALNESVSTWDASTLSELFSDVSVPSPPIGGVPAEPGCSYAKRVFLEAIEPVLAGTDGAALSGGYWKAQAPGSSVVVPGEPGPDSICVADIMDSAYELAKRCGAASTSVLNEHMLRFLLWRILWSKIGVGRGRPSLRNLANFLAVVHASSKSFPSAAPIWAEWKRWESQAFHKDALVSISSRARSGAIANPDDEHRPLAVKADGAARAAPDGSIFEHAPPLKRQRDGTTRGGYKRRWDWPKEEYTGPNAIGSHKAALVVAKPAEGWQGAPLLVLARVCSFLTLREAASFACVCTAFRCAAASVGLQGTLAGAVLGPEVQRLASAQALSHALGEKVREAASAVDLEAVEELERRGLKSADDILNDPNLANEQVGRLMRALKSLSKAPEAMSLNKRARALESRFEKELKPLRANVQKGFQSAVQKSAEIKQEVTHMVYSALHDATQPIKVLPPGSKSQGATSSAHQAASAGTTDAAIGIPFPGVMPPSHLKPDEARNRAQQAALATAREASVLSNGEISFDRAMDILRDPSFASYAKSMRPQFAIALSPEFNYFVGEPGADKAVARIVERWVKNGYAVG